MTTYDATTIQSLVLPDGAVGAKFTDTLDIDQDTHLLYMGDNWSGGVDIFDISTSEPRFVETVRLRGLLYGICVAKPAGKVFVGLNGSRLAAIDISAGSDSYHKVLAQIPTGGTGNTDLIDYDPVNNKVWAANRNEGFMVAVDATTHEITGRIDGLGGGLEQPRFNPADGYVYLAGNTDNVLYQIDPVAHTLVATLDIVDACNPNGIAINPETNQAILACSNRDRAHTVIFDLTNQKVASTTDDCGNGDGAIYDPVANRFFFAASGYPSGPVMGIFDGTTGEHLGNVATRRQASWVAYDQAHGLVYAPAIENGKPALLSFALPE